VHSRFPRIKQREQTSTITNLANVGPHATNKNLDPSTWAVKGTSVQAANAIHQAAMALNPNDSWASSTRTIVPRSTSVEYEKETQSTSTRRLPPPRKPPTSRSAAAAAKLSKQQSVRQVPDTEGEDAGEATPGRQERAKTPLESVVDLAKRTAFYLRQRSTEPDLGPSETSQNGHHNNESYDYEAEEREFQSHNAATKGRKTNNAAPSKRGRISLDNKAYRPSQSDLEDSDEDASDDGKRRRRKSKKSMIGPLTTLPVVGQEKRRRRRRGTKGDGGDEEGEDKEDDSGSDSRVSPQVCQPIALIPRLLTLISQCLAFYPFVSATLPAPGFTKTSVSSFSSSRSICPTSCTICPTPSRTIYSTSRSIYPTATYIFRG
jgi:SUN domain-containing protein 1/2